jgi:hypothetical protein
VPEKPEKDAFDVQINLDRLPTRVVLTDDILHPNPYLFAEPDRIAKWAPTFTDTRVWHVGLHWKAEGKHINGTDRILALDELSPLLDLDSVKFYSLRYDGAVEVAKSPRIKDLGTIDDPREWFMEFAAVRASLLRQTGIRPLSASKACKRLFPTPDRPHKAGDVLCERDGGAAVQEDDPCIARVDPRRGRGLIEGRPQARERVAFCPLARPRRIGEGGVEEAKIDQTLQLLDVR